jgi:hypothetical protein
VVAEATGKAEGEILLEERGRDGFGYDPLFYVPSLAKTMAEISTEEKNRISHRGHALRSLIADVHVSIVPAASVVARMEEALTAFTADPPRNISFLSGPSKTADIEQTLTVGAHGPKKAIALLLA